MPDPAQTLAELIEAHCRLGDSKLARLLRDEMEDCARRRCTPSLAIFLGRHHVAPGPAARRIADAISESGGCDPVTLLDTRYPRRIRVLLGSNAAPVLYCRGNPTLLDKAGVAVIGTRRPARDGKHAAASYARAVVDAGLTVISGNASGVDAIAHSTALATGGETVVFPPAPLDVFEPAFKPCGLRHAVLVASRFVPGANIQPWFFLARNALVAALAGATLVAETGTRGGTLDTVRHARRFGRPVFAAELTPGTRNRRAFEMLIAGGAKAVPVECSPDALAAILRGTRKRVAEPACSQPELFDQAESQ
jgi:DNA processing protein